MDEMRDLYVHEIKRIKTALKITRSEYARRDFQKAIRRMEYELEEYDRRHAEARNRETIIGV